MITPSLTFSAPFAVLAVHALGMWLAFRWGLFKGVMWAVGIARFGAVANGMIFLATVPTNRLP